MVVSALTNSKRVGWVDTAKGILILLVILGHITLWTNSLCETDTIHDVVVCTKVLYQVFFMQAFFILTGFCSNFDVPFITFVKKNLKQLLLPLVIIVPVTDFIQQLLLADPISLSREFESVLQWGQRGLPWFIPAMIVGRFVYWFIGRINNRWLRLFVVVILYLVALKQEQTVMPNYFWHRHGLMMLPYLFVGQEAKHNNVAFERWLRPVALLYFIVLPLQIVAQSKFVFDVPYHDAYICLSMYNWPIHVITALSGTAVVILISRKIGGCKLLNQFGQYTLITYLTHTIFIIGVVQVFQNYLPHGIIWLDCIMYVCTFIVTVVCTYCLAKFIYSSKYTRWIIGK